MFKRCSIIIAVLLPLAFIPKAYAAKDFNLKNNAQSFLYVSGTSGNVGINSTLPGQTLDVQGTIRSIGMVVTGNIGIGSSSPGQSLDINGAIRSTTSGLSSFTGNVGIGSVNPGQILDVQGTIRTTGFVLNLNPASGDILMSNGIGLGTWIAPSALGGGSGTVNTGAANQAAYYASSTAAVNGTTALIFNGSNVGIGSTVPGAVLDVQGTATHLYVGVSGNVGIGVPTPLDNLQIEGGASTSFIKFTNSFTGGTVGDGTRIGIDAGGVFAISNNEATAVRISTNGSERFRVDTGGNVGINSTVPGQKLDIQGTIRDIGEIVNGNVGINSTAPGQYLDVQGTVRALYFTGNGSQLTNISGAISGLTTNYVTKATSATTIGNSLIFDDGTNVGIGSAAPGAALDINGIISAGGSGNSYFSTGNLGIDSTVPGQVLDVQGTVRTTGFMLNLNPVAGDILMSNTLGVGTWVAPSAIGGGSGTVNTGTANQAAFYSSSTAAVSGTSDLIFNLTNVGINSATPGQTLDVQGTIRALNLLVTGGNVGINSATPGQYLDVQGTVRALGFTQMGASADTFGGTPTFSNGTYSALFTGGNVGINSTLPGQMLDVQGTIRSIGMIVTGNLGIGSTAPGQSLDINGAIRSTTTGFSTFAGNVGVGTLNPGQVFDVQGTIRTTGFMLNLNPVSGDILMSNGLGVGTWIAPSALGASGSGTVNTGTANQAAYYPSSTTAVNGTTALIFNGANVGIGSTIPGQILDVQGTVRALGFVQTGSFQNLFNGNVGVGTVNPGTALDVSGSMRATSIFFPLEVSNGTCNNTTVTINWNAGNKQTVIIGTATCNIAFTAPNGGQAAATSLLLRVVQDGTGGRSVASWTASPKWAGGSSPTLSAAASAVDIVTCYYNGTNYYCSSSLNFS